jgi:hypothetical protein
MEINDDDIKDENFYNDDDVNNESFDNDDDVNDENFDNADDGDNEDDNDKTKKNMMIFKELMETMNTTINNN